MIRFVARDSKDLTFREIGFSKKDDVELFYPTDYVVIFEESPTTIYVPIAYIKNNIVCTRSCI